jgi:ABC-type multidrug transport system ATPase subunit
MARLALARVLYHRPHWVISDEPFVGLDTAARSLCTTALMQAGIRMVAFETT